MRVRPDPLTLGKEFADEGRGTESHSDGEPGGAGSVFIPKLTGPNTGSGRYSSGADTKCVDNVRIWYQVDLVTA